MSADPAFTHRPSLTIRRRINAAPAKVFAAWTEPALIARWFGPDAGPVEKAEIDLRIGGRFDIAFRTEDGERHTVRGAYREIVPDTKLVFSWSWISTPERVSQVTVSLKADGGGTLLTLLHEQFFDQAARDGHNRGWTGSLDKLERLFA
ncbi:SRPBCC domain-containing protein [Ferrovibrio sp.]|uniref:SRPBCC family protein n=1 Tax=Ferrovibrio sp. TaxID=1917215 RepID=UPI00311E06DF